MQEEGLAIKHRGQLDAFLTDCEIKQPESKKIFEIGFRNGLFLNECHKIGMKVAGVEINKQYYEDTKCAFPYMDLILYDGGTIPVPDESFDYVISFQVLEHVKSIEHIFNECKRILKPGGIMYHTCPNYSSFYEGHYKIIWFPFINKRLGRWYLKLLRKYNPEYETLNILHVKDIRNALEQHKDKLTVISLGGKEFVAKFDQKQIRKVGQKFLRNVLSTLNAAPFIKNMFLKFICWANWYYPITIIATRKT